MILSIGALASGSSGNSYLLKSETTSILVDAGISGKQIVERLNYFGCDCVPSEVLITHEHSDHIQGLPALLKKGVVVRTTEKTAEAIECCFSKIKAAEKYQDLSSYSEPIEAGISFEVGDIEVTPFHVSHDAADPVGYSFSKDGACISIITDTGYVTEDCVRFMQKSDILVLESNHDESMLRIGRYPYFLKQRILSKVGHLSNEAAANAMADVLKMEELTGKEKKRIILLAHLSKENNFPQMALATMDNVLESKGVSKKNLRIETLSRTEPSALYEI